MHSFRASFRKMRISYVLALAPLLLMTAGILRSYSAGYSTRNTQQAGPMRQSPRPQSQEVQAETPQPQVPQSEEPQERVSNYDKSIFRKPIPSDQLAFLSHFSGVDSNEAIQDKQYRKLMHSVVSDCMFHYGRDMPLPDALEKVLAGSSLPVQIRDGRYVMVSGRMGPYLAGRGFMWIDMQEGIGLGGFYFQPTNGEPTPTVTIFSKQVKEKTLRISQLPPAFAEDLNTWSGDSRVATITTRYFITGADEKILLEHDEDYCQPLEATTAPPEDDCEQMNADAADIDLTAAYYLEQIHHATNGTAWMIPSDDEIAWIQIRLDTCRVGPDPLKCRIRMTRERTHAITKRQTMPDLPHK
jgi:hypothetical protein